MTTNGSQKPSNNGLYNSHASQHYVGRFAPSPTGLLHLGSLIGALASYLDARAQQGTWLVRMEDLDPPREAPGAAQAILNSLLAHGLQWDGEVLWQSQQHTHYQAIIEQLLKQGQAFYCNCSRSDINAQGGIYQGHCRGKHQLSDHPQATACAIRLQTNDSTIGFIDSIQGAHQQQLNREVGDFVIQRKDSLYAYQLAVVADDAQQGITHIVRGSDLLDSTARQLYLQQQLGYPAPHYTHIPVITHSDGQKLSKQSFAPAILNNQAKANLLKALEFLQQTLPPHDQQQDCQQILNWAIHHWQPKRIDKTLSRSEGFI